MLNPHFHDKSAYWTTPWAVLGTTIQLSFYYLCAVLQAAGNMLGKPQISWEIIYSQMAVCQNLVPLVNIKIAGKWMFIPLKMYL